MIYKFLIIFLGRLLVGDTERGCIDLASNHHLKSVQAIAEGLRERGRTDDDAPGKFLTIVMQPVSHGE